MTLTRLAELADTSVGTVSKAFAGSREVSEATRERIFKIAKEEGCFDKYYKAPRERPMVALLFPESESEHYGIQMGILERELNRRGADTIIAITRFDREREARLFRELAYMMKVDGVIVSGTAELISNPDEVPLVTITGKRGKLPGSDNVCVDMQGGIDELVRTLKAYGHKSVGFIGEELTAAKEKMFRTAMRREGLSLHERYIVRSSSRFGAAGEDSMKQLIERGDIPSVIVAAYDQIALGAMRYATAQGYKIPDDISFVGIDDITVTEYSGVPLSSIHINLEGVCEKVIDLLFKRMDNRHYRGRTDIIVSATLNVRESLKKIL
ncbi:MAG: LacI family DNA-binding transcriptional regulator [Clostridia bacterium]|nr:LacI family DNA-binding transcriptional regulator [Clostridia bacterium]